MRWKSATKNVNLRDFTAQNSLVVLCTLISVVLQGYKTQGGTFDGQRSKSLRSLEHQVIQVISSLKSFWSQSDREQTPAAVGKYGQIICNIGHAIKALELFGVSYITFDNKRSFVKLTPLLLYAANTTLKGHFLSVTELWTDHLIRIFNMSFRNLMSSDQTCRQLRWSLAASLLLLLQVCCVQGFSCHLFSFGHGRSAEHPSVPQPPCLSVPWQPQDVKVRIAPSYWKRDRRQNHSSQGSSRQVTWINHFLIFQHRNGFC